VDDDHLHRGLHLCSALGVGMSEQLLSVGQAALMLGVGVDTIHRYLDLGTLEGTRLPSGHRRITLTSVERAKASRVRISSTVTTTQGGA
jgi:excisionase family DNA binding protein